MLRYEFLDESPHIGCRVLVGVHESLLLLDGAEADARRLLDEDHVGEVRPSMRVHGQVAGRGGPERTHLCQESRKSRAARAAVRPQHQRVCPWVALALHEPIEELAHGLPGRADGQVARRHPGLREMQSAPWAESGQVLDQFFLVGQLEVVDLGLGLGNLSEVLLRTDHEQCGLVIVVTGTGAAGQAPSMNSLGAAAISRGTGCTGGKAAYQRGTDQQQCEPEGETHPTKGETTRVNSMRAT
mmetsp:Transcript_178819/g.573091  ORF Transcript_178819/g.573091 Transcript_178819/m.573091 type:complete len:242 (-) Transcript_178819:21-746(-)